MTLPDVTKKPMSDVMSLRGRAVVITGGAFGLGKAAARRLAEAGADIVIGDIDMPGCEATAAELQATYDVRVVARDLNVADSCSIAAIADFAIDTFGRLDVWVNNAGLPCTAVATEIDDAEWDCIMAINMRGTVVGAREAAKRMIAADRGGVIVNIASLAGMCGIGGQTTYGASKAGVIGMTRHLSVDLAPFGIRVLAIAPGVMLTENKMFIAEMDPEVARASGIPGLDGSRLGRLGVADDIARVVLFCASDLSLFMTGNTISVDGGVRA